MGSLQDTERSGSCSGLGSAPGLPLICLPRSLSGAVEGLINRPGDSTISLTTGLSSVLGRQPLILKCCSFHFMFYLLVHLIYFRVIYPYITPQLPFSLQQNRTASKRKLKTSGPSDSAMLFPVVSAPLYVRSNPIKWFPSYFPLSLYYIRTLYPIV